MSFASAASEPPLAFTTLLFKIPRAGDVTIANTCGVAFSVVRTAVDASGAETVIPFISEEGLPLTFFKRLSEKTTSAEVTFVPSANFAFGSIVKVNSVAAALTFHFDAIPGTGVEASPPLYVTSVS